MAKRPAYLPSSVKTVGAMIAEGMHISPYDHGNIFNPDPLRPKKLLLHKAEIRKLAGLVSRQGYTLIPLKVYLKDGRMKLEMGLCRGKQLHDKRDAAAEKDARREIERAFCERHGLPVDDIDAETPDEDAPPRRRSRDPPT